MNEVSGQTSEPALDYNPCLTAVRRLHDYLSCELPPEEVATIDRHLAACQGCFARFHFEGALRQTIRERVGEVHAPHALHDRVRSRLHALETAEDIAHESAREPGGEPIAADSVDSTE